MTVTFRVLAKGSFLLCVLVLLVMGFLFAWFASWRADRLAALESVSEIAESGRGPIEFLVRGEGPALLVFHGAPGGYDRAMLAGSTLAEDGFEIVAPSRPGYLRTPLSTGLSPEDQADAMAGLVDAVGLTKVGVLASSWGAPAAIQFALRHPQKVWALVLISAVTAKFEPQPHRTEFGQLALERLKGDFGAWLFFEVAERDPHRALSWVVDVESGRTLARRESLVADVLNDAEQLEWFRSFVGTFVPLSVREEGIRNDLAQIRALSDLPLEKIGVPTLVVHGTVDKGVPFSEAEAAARRIPGAILFPVEGAGHLVEIGPSLSEVRRQIAGFLREHSGRQFEP